MRCEAAPLGLRERARCHHVRSPHSFHWRLPREGPSCALNSSPRRKGQAFPIQHRSQGGQPVVRNVRPTGESGLGGRWGPSVELARSAGACLSLLSAGGGRWLPLGYLLRRPPTPTAGHPPRACWLHSQAGQVGGDTAAHSGHSWTGLPGRKAAGSAGHGGQLMHPQGHGWLLAGQWPQHPAQLCLSQWPGGWAREGPMPGAGPRELVLGSRVQGQEGPGWAGLCSAPAGPRGQGAPSGGLSRSGQ